MADTSASILETMLMASSDWGLNFIELFTMVRLRYSESLFKYLVESLLTI